MKKTLDFVLREMTSSEGGFYSAQDADSEGVEGKYYVWKKSEIKEILGDDADVFCLFYDVTDGGNWEGNNILCNNISIATVAFNFGIAEQQVKEILARSSEKLLQVREKRVHPGLDDKILTSWNALMITAFAKGYQISGEEKYLKAAKDCVEFIEKNLLDGQKLLRTYKNGKAKIQGYLEDYSYFVNALLDVFEITSEPKYLDLAKTLSNYLVDHFWDPDNNSFFMTADNHEKLIIRPKSNYDLSLPSGNSVSAFVLLKLYHITHDNDFLNIATKLLESQAQMAAENPFGFGFLLNTIYLYLKKPTEITIINTVNSELCDSINRKFIPESIIVTVDSENKLDSLQKYTFFAGKKFVQNKTQVYVCKNFSCSLPLEKLEEIESHL